MRARVVALVAAVALAVTACGTGSEEAAGDGGLGSGVGVHGAWTIDVYDADGTLANSAAFHNDLGINGATILDALLSRTWSAGTWAISLFGTPDQPCTDGTTAAVCIVHEPGHPGATGADNWQDTLALDPDVTDDVVILSGSATVANDTEIYLVATGLETCGAEVAPADCGADTTDGTTGNRRFTSIQVSTLDWDNDGTANDGTIPVTAGQTVQVTVEFSFGTLP